MFMGVFSVEYINIRKLSIFFALRINELAVLLFFARETRQLELSFADYNVFVSISDCSFNECIEISGFFLK